MRIATLTILISLLVSSLALSTDWTSNATLKNSEGKFSKFDRANIYELDQNQWDEAIIRGSHHALEYPVEVSELFIPFKTLDDFLKNETNSPLRKLIFKVAKKVSKFNNYNDLYNWVGLHKYPKTKQKESPNYIPPNPYGPEQRMGVTIVEKKGRKALTMGCASCHSADLFGVKILGMTNRFPRSNEFFSHGKKALRLTTPGLYQTFFNPHHADMELYKEARNAVSYVKIKKPLTLGLDTSLAQVALSLSRRKKDSYSTRTTVNKLFPRKNKLDKTPADSKPAVWWNLKYKTRWLSDGSIVSGNPVHTNFLWNELGRGTDLKKLEQWFKTNDQTIKDLTTYVFATNAPIYNDFFPQEINLDKAKRGQVLFNNNCVKCHGRYTKGWDDSTIVDYEDKIKTIDVFYHKKTPVINVGTDPLRYEGMTAFAQELNELSISKSIGTIVTPQKGYVPPPLVGIWARWPYFHNNSASSLFEVLTPESMRLTKYYAGPATDKKTDFDKKKNGYPVGDKTPAKWRSNTDMLFDSTRKGLSNSGHTKKILLTKEGKLKYNEDQKFEIIEFLKTL